MPLLILLAFFLSGCAALGINSPFNADPLTGGVNVESSKLLGIPIPAGMQHYPSHGFVRNSASGAREGLETLRGNVNASVAATSMFNAMHAQGWNLRASLRSGQKALYLYQKDKEYAILSFHKQGMLTILEIWLSESLPDGATLAPYQAAIPDEPDISIAPEEYGPHEEAAPKPGASESWGGPIEERDI